MGGEWSKVRLGDVADLMTGFPFESDGYVNDEQAPRLLRGDNVAQGTLRWERAKRWPADLLNDVRDYLLREGDIILAMDRPWIEAGLKFASVTAGDLPALLVQRVARLRGSAALDTRFLKYVVGSRGFTDYVLGVQTGTAVPHISGGQIRDFAFALPPLTEQRIVAHILGTLDDKIELNRRMNETLEAMARALFQSWFVDFDPVRAKAEGQDPGLPTQFADLFPDQIVNSEDSEIPRGWRLARLGDVVELLRDQENPLASPDVFFRHFSIPAFDDGRRPKIELGESIKSLKWRVPPGGILLSKLNPTIERVWLVDVEGADRAVCSTEFLVLRPRPPFGRAYAYCLTCSPLFRQQIAALVTGTSGSHQRAQVDAILGLPVTVPPAHIAGAFETTAAPLLGRTLECRRESRTLAALRDTLLPKLISGELRLKDAQRITGDAL